MTYIFFVLTAVILSVMFIFEFVLPLLRRDEDVTDN